MIDSESTLVESAKSANGRAPHSMQVDVLGCIRNTQVPLHAAFQPVFEAVVNSIHSTQDRFGDDVSK